MIYNLRVGVKLPHPSGEHEGEHEGTWSSLPGFLGTEERAICDQEIILNFFSSKEKPKKNIVDLFSIKLITPKS